MILAVDIGNTNVVLGAIEGERILFLERMATDRAATMMEYVVRIRSVLQFRGIDLAELEGAIVCSVVPIVTMNVRPAVEMLTGKKAVVVGPGIKTGLKINIDNPTALGADRVADAVAAVHHYPVPLITIDMGTATTVGVVDENKTFIGGMIERIEQQLGKKCTVVMTGGLSTVIAPHCKHELILDPELLLKGLVILYHKNARN